MTKLYTKMHALKEAWTDTFVGSLINVPLNFIMVSIAFHYQWTPLTTTIFMTCVFTVVAIARKTYIRLKFHNHYQKNGS
jgi:hypothetical protein